MSQECWKAHVCVFLGISGVPNAQASPVVRPVVVQRYLWHRKPAISAVFHARSRRERGVGIMVNHQAAGRHGTAVPPRPRPARIRHTRMREVGIEERVFVERVFRHVERRV